MLWNHSDKKQVSCLFFTDSPWMVIANSNSTTDNNGVDTKLFTKNLGLLAKKAEEEKK